ncbi:MAG: RHS repeat-associated core domain-containing protein [Flavobacteriales bacterium]|nr:RHS repeat-associated core domain-containing protein [Flavobacteriales bacterium]
MATYAVKLSSTVNRATLTEQHLYGASRLGMRRIDKRLYENGTSPSVLPDVQQNTLGNIAYEITNYLGNVNVVISDRKIWNTTANAFKAVTRNYTDYYPFGMEISSRTSVGTYRYGYNGMECDDENKGSGNSYTTEFRQYDPRLGRWLSLDPLASSFPWQSPYCAFDNNPVYFTDPTGLATEDWVKKEGSNKWEWDGDVKSSDAAKTKYGSNTEYAAPGTILDGVHIEGTDKVGTAQLLDNGRAKYFMDDVVVSAESSSKADDSFSFGLDLSSTMNASNGYNISNINELRANWQNMDQFVQIMHYATIGALSIPALPVLVEFSIFAAPHIVNSSITVGRLTINGFKLYHNTIGMNGGYANATGNLLSQSLSVDSWKDINISGVITAGFVNSQNSIITNGLLFAGASGGLYNVNLSGDSGFNILSKPVYGFLTSINGVVLGPTLNPVVGPFRENIGTGLYQRFLEETLIKHNNGQ